MSSARAGWLVMLRVPNCVCLAVLHLAHENSQASGGKTTIHAVERDDAYTRGILEIRTIAEG